MAESRRKSEAKTPKHHEDPDEPHKRRERIYLIVLLVGAADVVVGMILLAAFLSKGGFNSSDYPLAYSFWALALVIVALIGFEWMMRRRAAA